MKNSLKSSFTMSKLRFSDRFSLAGILPRDVLKEALTSIFLRRSSLDKPFLSLAVISYNSEKTISETLKSLEVQQGLSDVELIFFDDSSSDRTCEMISAWVARNQQNFFAVEMQFSPINLGVSSAHTQAFSRARGVWGTYLGGDDMIQDVSHDFFIRLQTSLQNVREHLVRLRVSEFWDETCEMVDFYASYHFMLKLSARRQFRYLASSGNPFRSGPGSVFRVETLKKVDGFGTYNRMYEDWQLFLRFTREGYRVGFCDLVGVIWRRHRGQVSSLGPQNFEKGNRLVKQKEVVPYLDRLSLFERWKYRHRGRISRRLHGYYQRYLAIWGKVFGG